MTFQSGLPPGPVWTGSKLAVTLHEFINDPTNEILRHNQTMSVATFLTLPFLRTSPTLHVADFSAVLSWPHQWRPKFGTVYNNTELVAVVVWCTQCE